MYLGEMGEAGGTQIINVDSEDACKNAGGFVLGFNRQGTAAYDQYGRAMPGNVICGIPIKAATTTAPPAKITVTVSPQIQTQVSPQISPNFQQQFQPSGSPMTAGTTQTSAPPVPLTVAPPAPPAGPIGVNATSMQPAAPAQLPPAPAPVPSYAAPSYAPPPPAPVSYSAPPQADQLPISPLPSSTPAPSAPQVTVATAPPAFDWKIPAIIGAGLVGVMAFSKRK